MRTLETVLAVVGAITLAFALLMVAWIVLEERCYRRHERKRNLWLEEGGLSVDLRPEAAGSGYRQGDEPGVDRAEVRTLTPLERRAGFRLIEEVESPTPGLRIVDEHHYWPPSTVERIAELINDDEAS